MATNSDTDLASLRMDYRLASLSRADVDADPFRQFESWFQSAQDGRIPEPNAFVLATVDRVGRPSTRTVLLKGIDAGGFVFFTNYGSKKGGDLAANPQVSATFLWLELERQIHISGTVEKVSDEESDAYFHVRPWLSQIGAVASHQSEVIPSREWLEAKFEELKGQFPEGGHPIPRPSTWGGYRILPDKIEFWQGRRSRLHDRLVYSKNDAGVWEIERLSP